MASTRGDVKRIGELLKKIDIAMLTTVGKGGFLMSRPLSTQQARFDGERVWFFTEADSPKMAEIGRNPKVNLAYASKGKNVYVSCPAPPGPIATRPPSTISGTMR